MQAIYIIKRACNHSTFHFHYMQALHIMKHMQPLHLSVFIIYFLVTNS